MLTLSVVRSCSPSRSARELWARLSQRREVQLRRACTKEQLEEDTLQVGGRGWQQERAEPRQENSALQCHVYR